MIEKQRSQTIEEQWIFTNLSK